MRKMLYLRGVYHSDDGILEMYDEDELLDIYPVDGGEKANFKMNFRGTTYEIDFQPVNTKAELKALQEGSSQWQPVQLSLLQ